MKILRCFVAVFILFFTAHDLYAQRTIDFLCDTVVAGTAMNGFSRAQVFTNSGAIYFLNDTTWDNEQIGKKLKIKGKLYLDKLDTTGRNIIINDVIDMYVLEPEKIKVVSLFRTKLFRELVPKEHRKDYFR